MIGIDLDDTLLKFVPNFIPYLNKKYGTDYRYEDFYTFEFWDFLAEDIPEYSRDKGIEDVYDFTDSTPFWEFNPIKGAQDAVKELKDIDDLVIVTARSSSIAEKTEMSLDAYFKGFFNDIFYTKQVSIYEEGISKGDICDKIGIDIFIDDALHNAVDCSRNGREVYLLNRPWNKDKEDTNGFIRMDYWEDIVEDIKSKI